MGTLDPRWKYISMMASSQIFNALKNDNKFDENNDEKIDEETLYLKYGINPEIDEYGLPKLPDKSKYKIVATEFCQKMGWKIPLETTQCVGTGHRAMVSFGETG